MGHGRRSQKGQLLKLRLFTNFFLPLANSFSEADRSENGTIPNVNVSNRRPVPENGQG
jgi:hypothetical protein